MISEEIERLMDFASAAKEANEDLPYAVKLKNTEEWAHARNILALKIAQEKDRFCKGIGADLAHYTLKQGFIMGMEFILQIVEKEFDMAMLARKKGILASATKLTEAQE